MNDLNKNIEIETNSPDVGGRKITNMYDFYEKMAWWNSLTGEQQQEWLKVFISNTQFIPIPEISRYSLKNSRFKNEDLPKLFELSPPSLERSQNIEFEPSPCFDNATNEFINNKMNETKNYMNDYDRNLQIVDDILNKPEYLELYGNEINQKSSKL